MGLVNAKEVAQAVNLHKFGFLGTTFGWALMKILNLNALNKIYNNNNKLPIKKL
mgnify:FL=1